MALGPPENWLVFVDTNILLDFYRLGGESAERSLAALERHGSSLILTNQVWMEFLKNRQTVIVDSINKLPKPISAQVPPILGNYQPAKTMARHTKAATASFGVVRDKIDAILRNPSANDAVYRSLKRIFDKASTINLGRENKDRFEVRRLARKRFTLGYPPRKNSDTSIGDAINWEWIVACANKKPGHHVLVVSRDGDYGVRYGNDAIINDWLSREFKERVSRKRRVELTTKLTVALKRLDEAVSPEDIQAEEQLLSAPKKVRSATDSDFDRIVAELLAAVPRTDPAEPLD